MSGKDYSITAERVEQMLSHGEDARTEFKFGMPIPTFLSRDLSAFANTGGGEILFGIDDTGKVVGTDIPELQRQIADALRRVTPGVETDFAEVVVRGKSVGALRVKFGDALHISSFHLTVLVLWSGHAAKIEDRCAWCGDRDRGTVVQSVREGNIMKWTELCRDMPGTFNTNVLYPEMTGQVDRVAETLSQPEIVVRSMTDSEAELFYRYYMATPVGKKYMCVVVKARVDDVFILTAYFTDTIKTGNDAVMEKVDNNGNVIGFSILKVSAFVNNFSVSPYISNVNGTKKLARTPRLLALFTYLRTLIPCIHRNVA